jgi:hypothetical protein
MERAAILLATAVAMTACQTHGQATPSPAASMLDCATNRALAAGFEQRGPSSLKSITFARPAGNNVTDALTISVTDSTLSVRAGTWVTNGPPPTPEVVQLAARIQSDCAR